MTTSEPEPDPQPQPEPHPETHQDNLQEVPVTQQPQKTDKENQSTQADKAPSKVCLCIKHVIENPFLLHFLDLYPFYAFIIPSKIISCFF